jgi:hypothetical protein
MIFLLHFENVHLLLFRNKRVSRPRRGYEFVFILRGIHHTGKTPTHKLVEDGEPFHSKMISTSNVNLFSNFIIYFAENSQDLS